MHNTIEFLLGEENPRYGRNKKIVLQSNLTASEIQAAYKFGCILLGFDFLAVNDPSLLSPEHYELLRSYGMEQEYKVVDSVKRGVYLSVEQFMKVYLFVVFLGDEEFEYSFQETNHNVILLNRVGTLLY